MPFISQVAVGRRPFLNVLGNTFKTQDGTGVRDYIHIMDLADGHVSALHRILTYPGEQKGFFEVFNLGSGKGYSVLDMVAAFERSTGVEIKYRMTEPRDGDVDAVYADASKALKVLGWKTKHDVDRMCLDTHRWQKRNPFGYQTQEEAAQVENNNIISQEIGGEIP